MRGLLPAFFACALSGWGAIARNGSGTGATSFTFSGTATRSLKLVYAYRTGSSTAPTLPAGWTSIATGNAGAGGTLGSYTLGCNVSSSGADTGSGTWTNATAISGLSYSGTNVDSTADCNVTGVSLVKTTSAKTSTTVSYMGITIEDTNNWVVGFMGDSTSTNVCTSANLTNVAAATGTNVSGADTNATVSSFSTNTCAVGSSTWMSATMQLQGPLVACSGTCPTLKRSWGFVGLSGNNPDTGNAFTVNLEKSSTPRVVTTGDLILVAIAYPTAASAPTISDSTGGSNTWASAVTCANAGLSTPRTYNLFYAVNATAGTNSVTVTFGAAQTNIQISVAVLYNVATTSPIDGTVCTTAITATNNAGSNIQSGVLTTTVDHDLVFNQVWDESNGTLGANTVSATGFGSGFTGLYMESQYGSGAQIQPQNTHGTITPGIGFAQATHDSFASLAVGIKSGAGGSAPTTGISIVRSQMYYNNVLASQNLAVAFPASGNLIVVDNETGTIGVSLTSVSDGMGNSYTAIASTPTGFPQLYHADNATTTNPQMNIVLHFGAGTGTSLIGIYDVSGAAVSPLDIAVTAANSSTLTAAGSGATDRTDTQATAGQTITDAPSLNPTAGDLVFAGMSIGTGPPSGSVAYTFDYVPFTVGAGTGDSNAFLNGDGMAHYFAPNTTTVNFGYTMINGTAASWNALAAAFKGPLVNATCTVNLLGVGPC